MTRPTMLLLAGSVAVGLLACNDSIEHDDDSTSTLVTDDNPLGVAGCEGIGWRKPTPGRVLCPGEPGCGCDLPTICCAGETIEDSACMAKEDCVLDVLGCDGPEDCNVGDVCCANNQEAQCVPEAECGILDEQLCRTDDDCPDRITADTCIAANPPAIGYCG